MGDFDNTALSSVQYLFERKFLQMPPISETRPDHNTGNFVPYSLQEVQVCFQEITKESYSIKVGN